MSSHSSRWAYASVDVFVTCILHDSISIYFVAYVITWIHHASPTFPPLPKSLSHRTATVLPYIEAQASQHLFIHPSIQSKQIRVTWKPVFLLIYRLSCPTLSPQWVCWSCVIDSGGLFSNWKGRSITAAAHPIETWRAVPLSGAISSFKVDFKISLATFVEIVLMYQLCPTCVCLKHAIWAQISPNLP